VVGNCVFDTFRNAVALWAWDIIVYTFFEKFIFLGIHVQFVEIILWIFVLIVKQINKVARLKNVLLLGVFVRDIRLYSFSRQSCFPFPLHLSLVEDTSRMSIV
jgi:hypothetical protein